MSEFMNYHHVINNEYYYYQYISVISRIRRTLLYYILQGKQRIKLKHNFVKAIL